jgi:hypothetical protein
MQADCLALQVAVLHTCLSSRQSWVLRATHGGGSVDFRAARALEQSMLALSSWDSFLCSEPYDVISPLASDFHAAVLNHRCYCLTID